MRDVYLLNLARWLTCRECGAPTLKPCAGGVRTCDLRFGDAEDLTDSTKLWIQAADKLRRDANVDLGPELAALNDVTRADVQAFIDFATKPDMKDSDAVREWLG